MLRFMAAVSAIALASPALSHDAQVPTTPVGQETVTESPARELPDPGTFNEPDATMSESEADEVANEADDMEMDDTQSANVQSVPGGTPTNSAEAVQALVDQEFANYDADGSGDLNKREFATWMTKLRTDTIAAQGQAGEVSSTEMEQWTEGAFAAADIDQSSTVTKPEISDFLLG